MGSGDNGGMTQITDDNRPTTPGANRNDVEHVETGRIGTGQIDPLDEIAAALDGLADLDPAEAVAVLADITAELNKELDADTERS